MGQLFQPVLMHPENHEIVFSAWPRDYKAGSKLTEHSFVGCTVMNAVERRLAKGRYRVIWAGEYADSHLYNMAEAHDTKPSPEDLELKAEDLPRYIVNHSKKVYIDKYLNEPDSFGYRLHPLPLLTAIGNGRGGGDYYGINMNEVGSWAGDIISLSDTPEKDYTEVKVIFKEGK